MNREFRKCLERGKISAFTGGKFLVEKELRIAEEDLVDGKFGLLHGKFKWSLIQGYYSMFHTCRALLYSQGYRERSHHCLYIAINALFAEEEKIEGEFVENFKNAMLLRENADYRANFTESNAALVIEKAGGFLKAAKRLLR